MDKHIIKWFQITLSTSLIILGALLTFLMLRELWILTLVTLTETLSIHDILQEVLAFFLYFAFVSMVIKYFKEDHHFPVRYLLYIGITGTLRFIIVNHDNAVDNLIFSIVILVLMIAYCLRAPSKPHH